MPRDDVPEQAIPNLPQMHHDVNPDHATPASIQPPYLAHVQVIMCSFQRGSWRDVLFSSRPLRTRRHSEDKNLAYEYPVQTHEYVLSDDGYHAVRAGTNTAQEWVLPPAQQEEGGAGGGVFHAGS